VTARPAGERTDQIRLTAAEPGNGVPDFAQRRFNQTFFAHVVQDVADPVCDQDTGRQIDAAAKLRACTAALGALRVAALLGACVVEDQSWRRFGQRLGVASETAREREVEAIAALALWLRGEMLPPAPAVRFRN
jgi:hypothetical protein